MLVRTWVTLGPRELPSAHLSVVDPRTLCVTLGPHNNMVDFRACLSCDVACLMDTGYTWAEPDWASG